MGLFTQPKKLKFKEIPSAPEQTQARNWLQDLYQSDFNAPVEQTADLTPNEQTIQQFITDYLPQMQGNYGAAEKYYQDVVAGGYDPRTSPAYAGYRDEADRAKTIAQNQTRRGLSHGGVLGSTPGAGMIADTGANYDSKILSLLGNLYENERNRQTGAAGALMELPSRRIAGYGAASTLSEKPRQIEQAKYTAMYNAAMQDLLAPYLYKANIALALLNEQRYAGYETGGGMTDWGFLINAGASAAGSYFGAKAGAAA